MNTALTIAGSDPSGGAGIQGDLKTFAGHGVHGMAVITSLTAQNTTGVRGVHDVPAAFVAAQLECVLDDVPVSAAKTGMVSSTATIEAIARVLDERPLPHLVVDPVMIATSGDALIAADAIEALVERLFPLAEVVTPNTDEAARLCGFAVDSEGAMHRAARELVQRGARAVLVKGGHLPGTAVIDLLLADGELFTFTHERVPTDGEIHGSGCCLAAGIAAQLARGASLHDAVAAARAFVRAGIESAVSLGRGARPVNHLGAAAAGPW